MTTDSPSAPPGLDKRDWIAGLERGVAVIEAFDDAHPRLTASEAGQRTGMTRTAARRYRDSRSCCRLPSSCKSVCRRAMSRQVKAISFCSSSFLRHFSGTSASRA